MYGGGNRINGLHVIMHNGLFAECGVLDNIRGLCAGPRTRTRTRTCKLVLEEILRSYRHGVVGFSRENGSHAQFQIWHS